MIQKEVDGLNRLASSQSPERLANIEAKRQAIKDKYEQRRAKEFQDWLKTQKTIGTNRSTNWDRQSRISELRQSISQRRDNTNQLIQREIDGLNRISQPFASRDITEDYLNKLQKAVQIAIRQFGANSSRAIQLLDRLNATRNVFAKQEIDKINRVPKTKQEINEQAELTKKRKEQDKNQQQKAEKKVQKEITDLNRLASSLSIAQSPERLAELERKRQAIKDKYEQRRAKEFQDWLKTQKTIGTNRSTNWDRQSRISELRQSISQRRDNTNQLIQREVDGLNRIALSQSPERLAELERKRQAIKNKYEEKKAKEFQDWLKTQNVGINRSTNWNRQSRISELRQSIGQRRDNTNQLIQREVDGLNRIASPFNNRNITDSYLSRLQKAVQIAIRQFGTNSNRTIELLNKLESAREIVAKQEADKANRVPKTKQEINQQAESIKRKREQEAKLKQETERSVQKEITDLNRLASSLSIAQSPERLGDIEAKRQAIKDKYEQKRAKEFQDWLKTQKTIGINRSTNRDRQSRISELRQSIGQRRDNTNQLIQREVDGLNRISSPSFATKEINQDYLNKLQKAVQIAVRQFGANSNRTIELLNKLESARDVFIQQEANKAQKNQRIKSPQEWKSIKEQEKKRQQEAEKRVQEEIEGLRRLGRTDPKAMANIEARRKIILDRRAAREKEARERAELARLKQERQEETSLQGFLNRPLRALNRVRRSTFADAKIETLAQKYADFGTESYFDKFFRNMSNSIKRKISKDPSERETVAREGFGMLFGMTAMSNPLLPALASLAPLALPLLPTALAVSGGINMVSPAFQGASQRIQGVENFNARLNAVTGDPLKSDTEYKYLLGLAEKYRVSLQSLSEGYTQLAVATRGTKLEGEATKELFSAITASIKALRLNTFDAGLVLNAYTQIVAKGKISMEELRQQLGEKFPPTMSVFAKALGVSQSELGQLVAKGSLLSDEVLQKVTKVLEQEFGAAAEKGTSDFTSALASMETALFKLDRNFTDIFGGMFAGITNLASGIVTSFSDNFRIISQLAGAFTIGVVAQVGIGLSEIMKMPKIAPVVSSLQSFILKAWGTALITLTPFMSGILADVIDDVFNTENDLFTNMAKGTTNIIAASIGSLENISYGASGKGFFGYNWEKAVNPIQSIGNTLGNLFKSIPSGVFELTALTFMFEQLIVLGQMFLMPLLSNLWLTFKGMGGAIWTAATNAKSLGGVFDTLFASSAMAKGALVALNIALKAFVALGFMAFARSDFTNPLQASLNESEQKIGASIDNIQNLLNKLEAPTLEVKVKGGDELPSKGLELNLMAMLGDESSSYKTDDAIKEGKGFIPSDNPLIRFHAEHLAKQEIPAKQQEAKRFGLEKYLNDYNGFFTLAQDQLLNSARDLSRVNQEVSKALTKQSLMPETVGKSINLLNPFANEAKIIDASIQRLQKERTTAGLTNTSESKVRIREIDKEIKRLNDLRKEKIKPLDEFMTDFESLRKGLNSRIEAIDKQDLPEGAKKALRAIVEGNQKIVEETRKSLEEAGFYDILTPLESAWQKATDAIRDFEVQYEKTMRRIENKSLNDQTAVYRSNLNPVQIGEQTRNIEIQTQKERIKQFETNLTKQQQTLEQYLSVPESGRTQEQVDAIEETRKATFEAEKELASARLSLAKSEYDATQDRLRKQQSETKLRVDSEIARKRIDVIRANPFGGVNASLRNAEIDVEERIQAIGLLYQQLADNTGNPIEIKSQIVAAELALEQARANLLQQQTSLQDYYRNLDRQIVDFNRQIEDYRRQIEDAQLSVFKENRSLSESYSDLVRELDKNLLNAQNQLLDTTDRIRVQQVKNRLLIPGTSDAGKELGDIFLEFVQGQADLASRGRTFQSRTEEIETSYISTLRNIRNLQEQQQEAERNRLRTIEDIKRTQENLNRTLADLIRQTNRELGFIPQSIKDIVTNLNTLPEPIKLINSELVAIPPNIKTSGEDLVKSIEETAEAIRKAKEGLILPAPSNFIPAPVWNGGGFLPPPPSQLPSQSSSMPKGLTRRGQELFQHLDNPHVKAFLDTIAYAEGTANMPNKGYNTLFGHGQFNSLATHPNIRVPFGNTTSTAAGRYQAMNFVWDEEKVKLGLKDFSPISQDLLALSRIEMRGGLDELLEGDIRGVINAVRKEWASFPGANYPGQGMKRMEDLLNFYQQSLRKYQPNAPRTTAELDALRYDGNPANSGALNRIRQIRRNHSGQGGPEFSSPPPIAQSSTLTNQNQDNFWDADLPPVPKDNPISSPTLPNQNQDNFWDADLPPVPKDNPINFQNPSLPPVPNLPTDNLGTAAGQIREAEIANQEQEERLRQLESSFLTETTLDRIIKFGRQQEEEARDLNRTIRDASESVTDLTINSKGYLTVQEEINKSATEVSRQYRSQIESLQDQRRNLEYQADGWQKMSENIKESVAEQIALGKIPADLAEQLLKNADALAERAKAAKEQVVILDQAIEQLGRNQEVAALEASFRKTRDTVRSIRDRMNDLTIQRMKLENQSRPTLFDDSAILAERISLQKEKEELEDYLEPYKDLPEYAEYVTNIRSEWEKLAELRLERVALDASPNRNAAESFFSDIREGKGIGSAFSSLGLNILTKFVEGITKPAIDALTLAIDGFTKPITQAFESVFNAIIGPVGNFFTNALNSIFKPAGNIFSSIFGGGGSGGLVNGLLSGVTGLFGGGLGSLSSTIAPSSFISAPASSFSAGTGFKLFSDGGKVGDTNAPIEKNIISAFQRERAMSGGRKPRLIVANEDELVLNPKETEAYLEYRNNAPIKNYANGGFVGGKPSYSTTSNNNNSNQSLVINNTNNVTVESRNDMGYSLNQLKERENAQNERTKKRFFG